MNKNTILIYLLLPQALLIAFTAACGLLFDYTYALETFNWRIQSVGQDAVDFFLVLPVLLVSAIAAYRGSRIGAYVYGGTQLFLIYTYLIYCFSVHFGYLFIPYCLTLGLSFYSFIYFLNKMMELRASSWFQYKTPVRFISAYFFVIAIVFYMLWLQELLPATLINKAPGSLIETGLFTNPVHIIDISLFLPGLIVVALLLRRRKPAAFLWAPVMLAFFVLMDLNISALVVLMHRNGLSSSLSVAWTMSALALVSVGMLYLLFKNMAPAPAEKTIKLKSSFAGYVLFL